MRAGDDGNIRCGIGEAVDGVCYQCLASSEIAGRKLDAGKDYIYYKPNPGYFANIGFAQRIQFFFGFIHPIGSLDKYGKIERYRIAGQASIVVGFDCFMPIFSI